MSTQTVTPAQELAAVLSNFVNGSGRQTNDAIDIMMREHRTLQQGMMRFCCAFITAMSTQEHDLRNEASVALAKKMVEKFDKYDMTLPYI